MDTVEQISGYFYKGYWNLKPEELFLLILIDAMSQHLEIEATAATAIEQEIIDYIYTHHSHKKYCFFGDRPEVTLDTELTKGGLNIIWEDAEDTLDYYFKKWNVKMNGFEIIYYFEPEFLGSMPPEKPLKPLTVQMLVESAKAGEWLYD
ncbi:DUF1493 family protein [Klebsiella aerogenes]|uniref:DUF1493 family protein n=1 Tax=Klebsiella aerogenes TaxID=548 RepID=UPI003A80AB29